ncbi:MAG: transporter [Devosia sp.]
MFSIKKYLRNRSEGLLSLKPFHSKAAGTPDLLPYASLIAPGVVLGKDGSLMAGFFFRGDDAGCAAASSLNYVTAQVNSYLLRFGSEWAMWVDASRISSPGYPEAKHSHFTDPISKMIDAERREMFMRDDAFFETEYAMVFQYLPPLRSVAKFGEWIYDDAGIESDNPATGILAEFNKRLTDFQDGLGKLLNMHRMGTFTATTEQEPFEEYQSDQFANYLHFAISGKMNALRIPSCPMYMDSWLGYEELWPGNNPKLGDKYISCVAIDGFPSESYPGILSSLETLAIAYRWSSRFIFLEQHVAAVILKKYWKVWKQWVRGFVQQVFNTSGGVINTDALEMTQQVGQAINDGNSGLVSHGYYTPVIVLMNEDINLLREQSRQVRKLINGRGFNARIEGENTLEAWLGSLPGMTSPNVRRPMMHTLNLADLLPLSAVWQGLSANPCSFYPVGSPPLMRTITTGATPFELNLHVAQTGHVAVFGPTGSGKSLLLGMVAGQALRYQSNPRSDGSVVSASVTVFDYGHSMYALCKAVGGGHYDIGADGSGLSLCPLSEIDTESDRKWAEEWVAACYELQMDRTATPVLTPDQKNEIHTALLVLKDKPKRLRSLQNFNTTVQDKVVREAMTFYEKGNLLNGRTDDLKYTNFTVFEIEELMGMGEKVALAVLLYLFRRFDKTLVGQPSFLLLDEAWVMLGSKVFREKIRDWLNGLRKKNCAVILATQSLSAAVKSGILDTIIEQCPTKIFLPNNEAKLRGTPENPGPANYYEMFGLPENVIEQIASATPKRSYLYRSVLGTRWFELGVGPLALSFVGVSDKDSVRDVKVCEDEHGVDWPLYWLKKRGVKYAKYAA